METVRIDGHRALEFFGGLLRLLIHRRQRGDLFAHLLQVLLDFAGEAFLTLEQEVLLGVAGGSHLDLDFQRQRLAHLENALQLLIVSEHRLQGSVVVPDDADEEQADERETDPDLFADPQFAGNLVHGLLLAVESSPLARERVGLRSPAPARDFCDPRQRARGQAPYAAVYL